MKWCSLTRTQSMPFWIKWKKRTQRLHLLKDWRSLPSLWASNILSLFQHCCESIRSKIQTCKTVQQHNKDQTFSLGQHRITSQAIGICQIKRWHIHFDRRTIRLIILRLSSYGLQASTNISPSTLASRLWQITSRDQSPQITTPIISETQVIVSKTERAMQLWQTIKKTHESR